VYAARKEVCRRHGKELSREHAKGCTGLSPLQDWDVLVRALDLDVDEYPQQRLAEETDELLEER